MTVNRPLSSLYPSSLTAPQDLPKIRYRRWIIGILLALLIHGALLLNPNLFVPKVSPPPRVALEDISAAKLDAIRRQWKERPILLNTDPNKPDPNAPPPKDARYDSDRNKTVPKEQRARVTNVIPKVGGVTGAEEAKNPSKPGAESAKSGEKKAARPIQLKDLSNFALRPEESPTFRGGRRAKPQDAQEQKTDEGGERGETVRGGDQALMDKNLAEGDQNILNTQESKYYSFYARIHETIGPLWQSLVSRVIYSKPFSMGEYTTRVEVTLDSEGNYESVQVVQSSGSKDLDRVIEEAWSRIKRFPNPPHDLLDQNGKVRMGWSFSVNLDQQTGLQFAPPRRNY